MIQKMKSATKDEFELFVATYPHPTKRSLLTICQPEILQINDSRLGIWPDSVIAQYQTWGCDSKDIWAPVPGDWKILDRENSQ